MDVKQERSGATNLQNVPALTNSVVKRRQGLIIPTGEKVALRTSIALHLNYLVPSSSPAARLMAADEGEASRSCFLSGHLIAVSAQ